MNSLLKVENVVKVYGDYRALNKVSIEVPEKISKKQKEILKEFEKESKKKKGIFSRIF